MKKKIIIVTLAIPAAFIAAAEAIPLAIMASKSSMFSTIISSTGRAFTINSGKSAAINGGLELGGQYLSNGMTHNQWSLNSIDWADVSSSAAFGKGGDILLGSAVDFSFEKGFQINADEKLFTNLAVGIGKNQLNSGINNSLGSTIGKFSPVLSNVLSTGSQLNINVIIDSAKRKIEE